MRASWVRPENYHLTVRFLGEIEPMLTVDLERVSRRITTSIAPFALSLDRFGGFPSIERPRVLWFGGETPSLFRGLATSLSHDLGELGFPPEDREPDAHVTIARIKGRPDPATPGVIARLGPVAPLPVHVDRLVLMQSELTPAGAIYTPLFSTPLGGGDCRAD